MGQGVSPLAPDAIYYYGHILTVDESFTISEAFAVKGDHFIAVGTNAAVRALAGTGTQQVDLRGQTVIPGLMDNHNHQIWKSRIMQCGRTRKCIDRED
jgi:predicted amidohydrolase YtcJ